LNKKKIEYMAKKRSRGSGKTPVTGIIALVVIIAAVAGIAYTTMKGKGKGTRAALGIIEPSNILPDTLLLSRVQPHSDLLYTMGHFSADYSNGLGVQHVSRRGQAASHLGSLSANRDKLGGSIMLVEPSIPTPIKIQEIMVSDPNCGGVSNLATTGVPTGRAAF
jgi:hypothetical protein